MNTSHGRHREICWLRFIQAVDRMLRARRSTRAMTSVFPGRRNRARPGVRFGSCVACHPPFRPGSRLSRPPSTCCAAGQSPDRSSRRGHGRRSALGCRSSRDGSRRSRGIVSECRQQLCWDGRFVSSLRLGRVAPNDAANRIRCQRCHQVHCVTPVSLARSPERAQPCLLRKSLSRRQRPLKIRSANQRPCPPCLSGDYLATRSSTRLWCNGRSETRQRCAI